MTSMSRRASLGAHVTVVLWLLLPLKGLTASSGSRHK